jgi:hypothetical protein
MTKALWALACAAARGLWSIVKTAMTGPDNQSWAPGRIMGFSVFAVGQCLVIRIAQWGLDRAGSLGELLTVFSGVSAFEAAICCTAVGLVLGMAPSDPGGRWWEKQEPPQSSAERRG